MHTCAKCGAAAQAAALQRYTATTDPCWDGTKWHQISLRVWRHALLAAAVLGRLSDADAHTVLQQTSGGSGRTRWLKLSGTAPSPPLAIHRRVQPRQHAGGTTTGRAEPRHTTTRAATGLNKATSVLIRQRPRVRLLIVGQVPVGKTTR